MLEAEPGRVLDIGCGDGRDVRVLAGRGWEAWGLDPSPYQLGAARRKTQRAGGQVALVQAVAEQLPFRNGSFHSVMTKSALDHFVDGRAVMREIARILQPGGRAVVTAVNYAGLACRLSRLLYVGARFVGLRRARRHLFWDSPVRYGHEVECTYRPMTDIGRGPMALQQCYGVSLLMGLPRWGWLLDRLPRAPTALLLSMLDRLARGMPRLADVVVCVWRRPSGGSQG